MTQEVPETRILKNGAVYDMQKHRIVANPGGGTAAITQANASAYSERRRELKRKRLMDAANAVAEQTSSVRGAYFGGEAAFFDALGEAMAKRALNTEDVKGVDAARFVLQESGLAESKQQEAQVVRHEYSIDAQTAEILQLIASRQQELSLIAVNESIDADTVPPAPPEAQDTAEET